MSVVLTDPPRVPIETDAFASYGVATIAEAQNKTGLIHSRLRPIFKSTRMQDTAVTVSLPPRDDDMISGAVEQCEPDDLIVAVVSRNAATDTLARCKARERKEAGNRERFAMSKLGFDVHGMRETLRQKSLVDRKFSNHHGPGG